MTKDKKLEENVKRKYDIQLKRKKWKKLSNTEKYLFEWFYENLNGDVGISAMLAVDLHEEIILKHYLPISEVEEWLKVDHPKGIVDAKPFYECLDYIAERLEQYKAKKEGL